MSNHERVQDYAPDEHWDENAVSGELAWLNARIGQAAHSVRDLERERDEALESAKRWEEEARRYAGDRDHQKAERDAARAQVAALQDALRKIAVYAKPVVDRLWESGQSQPAEVIRLGEATQDALALVEDT